MDPNGVTINYTYGDSGGALSDISYVGHSSEDVSCTYDSYGRLSSVTDATGSRSYTYGDLDELISYDTTYSGLSAKTISYDYNLDGSRNTMTTPAGTFTYSYDGAGRETGMTNPYSESSSWTYLNNNWMSSQTLGNGTVSTYSQNAGGQTTAIDTRTSGGTILSQFGSISYDGKSNMTGFSANLPAASSYTGTIGFTFDSKNQLTQETSTRLSGYTHNYGYDAAGNPTTLRGVSQTFNTRNQRTAGGYAFDSNGNPTTYAGNTLTFDVENRMTSFGSVMSATYMSNGLRASKTSSGTTIYYLYDGFVPVCELDGSGNVVATNTFGRNGLLSRHTGSGSTFYTFDLAGGTAQRLDGSQNILTSHMHDAFGVVSSSSATTDPYIGLGAQAGYYRDSQTGLQLLGRRYYDPSQARFLNRDPIGQAGGLDLYAYVLNNPVNQFDPSGLCPGGGPVGNGHRRGGGGGTGSSSGGVGAGVGTDDPNGPLWFDGNHNEWMTRREMTKKAIDDNLPYWLSWIPDTCVDMGTAFMDTPYTIGHLGQGSGTNAEGAWHDLGTVCSLGLAGLGSFAEIPEAPILDEAAESSTAEEFVDLTGDRAGHILDGDPGGGGGGHYHGTGIPGKSEFPAEWSREKVLHEISDVATDPKSVFTRQSSTRVAAEGVRDGIHIKVIIQNGNKIITGFPTNVPRNPYP